MSKRIFSARCISGYTSYDIFFLEQGVSSSLIRPSGAPQVLIYTINNAESWLLSSVLARCPLMPCQDLTAAKCTRHVTNAEMMHQYLKKENTAKLPIECDAHLETGCHFFVWAAIFSFFSPPRGSERESVRHAAEREPISSYSSDCWPLMSTVDGESFQNKLLKTSGRAFSLMHVRPKHPSRWSWHGNR